MEGWFRGRRWKRPLHDTNRESLVHWKPRVHRRVERLVPTSRATRQSSFGPVTGDRQTVGNNVGSRHVSNNTDEEHTRCLVRTAQCVPTLVFLVIARGQGEFVVTANVWHGDVEENKQQCRRLVRTRENGLKRTGPTDEQKKVTFVQRRYRWMTTSRSPLDTEPLRTNSWTRVSCLQQSGVEISDMILWHTTQIGALSLKIL